MESLDVVILGASFDKPEENSRFREKYSFPFSLLCDTDRTLGLAYGACEDPGAKSAKRITVVIGPEGDVLRVYPEVQAKTHPEQVLRDLGS